MKKLMIAAVALTMVGGAAFAQNTTKAAPKKEAKTEVKSNEAKPAPAKKKVSHKKAEAATTKTEAAK